MFRGMVWLWVLVMLTSAGLSAGGMGQADTLEKTYTVEDWEEGGKMHQTEEEQMPDYLSFMEPNEEEEPALWTKQLVAAISNLALGITHEIATFAESNNWVPWVIVSQLLILVNAVFTLYILVKGIRPDLALDLLG